MDDPDSIALRFLRARKWSVTAGVAMVSTNMSTLLSIADEIIAALRVSAVEDV